MFKSYNVLGAGFVNRYYSTKRLTNEERNSFIVPPNLHEIMIGLILGDIHISRKYNYSRLQFKQGLDHKEYIYHLFDTFSDYINAKIPRHTEYLDKRTNKVYTSIVFNTYSLPCFDYYHDLFYINGVKKIPLNIGELLTPVGLAYWAMDDGGKKENAFYLNTDSFSLTEVELLIKVLKENFDLNCTYHVKRKDQHRIYIRTDSMDKFRILVTPYFIPSMMYKLTT
jgi:hypothetical protein